MRLTDAAFEGAVERYGDTVFRLAYSYLKNRADAEDVMQETLLKLYLERKPFRSPEHERYWVVRVAVNESKKLLRSPWRRRTGPLEEAGEPVFDTPQQSELYQHVMGLPPKYRAAVYLYYYMVMALAVTAGAVNVATDGEFFRQFTIVWTSGNQYLAQDNQGNEVYVTVAAGEPVTKENGRLILHAQGEEIDITEAMETAGAYHYAYDMDVVHEDGSRETRTVTIDVTGDLDRWTVSQDNGDGTSYETVSGDNGLTEFSGTMTGQAADHFTADLPDADESSVVEAKAQEIAPAD